MTFNDEQNAYISRLYELADKSTRRAAEMFEEKSGIIIDTATIRNRWKSEGHKIQSHGGYRHGISETNLRSLYQKYRGDLRKMVEESGIKILTLETRCGVYDLPTHNMLREKTKVSM